jgi:HAMP domain-containing protein
MLPRILESNEVVRMGPMGLLPELNHARLLYQYLLYAVLALPIFLWLHNLQNKARRLEKATSHFGKGDFSVRVSEKPRHKVGESNHTFNQMAEHVERLIKGHKSLTNAAVAHELRTPVSRVRS